MAVTEVIGAQAIPVYTINQQSELIAINCAFQLAQAQSLNIYTDSNYTFHILLSCAAIWK